MADFTNIGAHPGGGAVNQTTTTSIRAGIFNGRPVVVISTVTVVGPAAATSNSQSVSRDQASVPAEARSVTRDARSVAAATSRSELPAPPPMLPPPQSASVPREIRAPVLPVVQPGPNAAQVPLAPARGLAPQVPPVIIVHQPAPALGAGVQLPLPAQGGGTYSSIADAYGNAVKGMPVMSRPSEATKAAARSPLLQEIRSALQPIQTLTRLMVGFRSGAAPKHQLFQQLGTHFAQEIAHLNAPAALRPNLPQRPMEARQALERLLTNLGARPNATRTEIGQVLKQALEERWSGLFVRIAEQFGEPRAAEIIATILQDPSLEMLAQVLEQAPAGESSPAQLQSSNEAAPLPMNAPAEQHELQFAQVGSSPLMAQQQQNAPQAAPHAQPQLQPQPNNLVPQMKPSLMQPMNGQVMFGRGDLPVGRPVIGMTSPSLQPTSGMNVRPTAMQGIPPVQAAQRVPAADPSLVTVMPQLPDRSISTPFKKGGSKKEDPEPRRADEKDDDFHHHFKRLMEQAAAVIREELR